MSSHFRVALCPGDLNFLIDFIKIIDFQFFTILREWWLPNSTYYSWKNKSLLFIISHGDTWIIKGETVEKEVVKFWKLQCLDISYSSNEFWEGVTLQKWNKCQETVNSWRARKGSVSREGSGQLAEYCWEVKKTQDRVVYIWFGKKEVIADLHRSSFNQKR